ncbi:type I restriction endonuclease subunit R [Aurantivibrio plasticivorans]
MVSKTNEQALEAAIEKYLCGTCKEEQDQIKYPGAEEVPFSQSHGYAMGKPTDFDAKHAVDTYFFWQFLQNTQADELEKLKKNGADWQRKVLERFDRMAKKVGLLQLLKKGLSVDDAHLHLMYPAPLASSSDKVKQDFAQNIFSSTRQVRYSLENTLEEIDMVLFINGLPFATLELKNPWTRQTARYHGQKQYRDDRDTRQTLLQFGRCLVHMTVDTDEVYMTTKLAGKSTFFLPFNKGNNFGAGNPPNPKGHKSSYLWQEVFSRESIANIIQHFVRLDGSSKDALSKRTLFFPRYHQLDVVRRLIAYVSEHGVGSTYLIQHSAGSGKSNSITWAAYQLIEAYPDKTGLPGAKALDEPLFDSVIVVTDRRLLDRQLRDNIKEFSEVKNIIAPAYKSSELKEALEKGKKIVITTIQKFPFIIDGIADLSEKRFAVIIDEAHSSQSGLAHGAMNEAMGNALEEEEQDAQDKINKAMEARKMRGNASYFAFTATPKNTTLEKFGVQQPDGSFKPFHLYSMKQAIEEGFILDVLANYTTYRSYYEIQKSIEENPLFDSAKAQKKLRAFVERNPATIKVKAEIMLDHFIENVINTKKLRGKAKGIIVTQNIESAIHYYQAIDKLLAQKSYPFHALIAFSGKKQVKGIEYTEAEMNGFSDNDTRDYFDHNYKGENVPKGVNQDKYRLLIVANKYLTGFDQPKLTAMYVDKKLAGVLCVQAISRLNRAAPSLGKKTEDLFVLDFFNSVEDIKSAFDPFYTATTLTEPTDINVLHELKDNLDEPGVYEWHEVEEFVTLYFNDADAQDLSPIIDVAANRFNLELELADEEKADFKIKAKQFVKIYSQMASIMPFDVVAWEKLFWFLKFLIPKLKVTDPQADQLDELLSTVDLSTYALQRVRLNHSIGLDSSETELDPTNPNPRGAHGGEEQHDPLDEIIRTFNERWFDGWGATPEEQKVKFVSMAESIKTHPDFEEKYKNNKDAQNRELAFRKIFEEVILKHRKTEMELYKLLATDTAAKTALRESLKDYVE